MRRKRKNAGKGFGMMFHGNFKSKKEAKSKERQTGGFMKRLSTPHGTRYMVMSERKNPIKRKKKAAKPNPHELLVMGANPHATTSENREITLPAGSTLTIRMNPTNPDRFTSAHAIARGIKKQAPGLIQTGRQRKVAKMVRGARKHRYEWIPSEGIAPGQNPSAATLREEFTGMPAERYTVRNEPHMRSGDYAQLGKPLVLYVKPLKGGQVLEIRFRGTLMVSDERARAEEHKLGPIWFVGGDQDVTESLDRFGAHDRGDLIELGEARRIDYEQRKEHTKDPDEDHWRHEFGEETDERPTVLFNRNHKRLLLEGGAYEIRREGIVN